MRAGAHTGAALLLTALALGACGKTESRDATPATTTQDSARPNVMWIVLDACRARNLSCYGYERQTSPNIDALAREGMLFEQHYTQGSWTGEAVPSYLTGRYFGAWCLGDPDWYGEADMFRLPTTGERLLPVVLRENGYHTAIATPHSILFDKESRVFDGFKETLRVPHDPALNRVYMPFERVEAEVSAWLRREREQPFFLYLHVLDTHFPHQLEPPFDQWVDGLPHSEAIRDGVPTRIEGAQFAPEDIPYMRGLHDGGILYADHYVGRIIEQLKAQGLYDRTIILITADHGDALGEDGATWGHHFDTYDEILHVPLILRGPGIPDNRRVASFTENTDIAPTLYDLLGIDSGAAMDGVSLCGTGLCGTGAPAGQPPGHDFVFTRAREWLCIRDGDARYERSVRTGAEHLWRVPDTVPTRESILETAPDVLARMRARMDSDVLPRFQAFHGQLFRPATVQISMGLSPFTASPGDALAVDVSRPESSDRAPADDWAATAWANDGRWRFDNAKLASAPQEDCPPVTFELTLPDGRYSVELYTGFSADLFGYPAGPVRMKAQDDSEYALVEPDGSGAADTVEWVAQPVGEYAVEDRTFSVTFDDIEGAWSLVYGFRFNPLAAQDSALTEDEMEERRQQLEALGYMNTHR